MYVLLKERKKETRWSTTSVHRLHVFFFYLLRVPTPTRNISRLSRLEKKKKKYLNSQEAFTSEREGARAWASATTTTTSGEECQQVFLFLPSKKNIILPC
jgi:hypothetical protein